MSDETRRKYLGANGERLPGVTDIISLLEKPALPHWYAKLSAQAAVDFMEVGANAADAVSAGRKEPERVKRQAADAGSLVHAMAEAALSGHPEILDDGPLDQYLHRQTAKQMYAWVRHWERTQGAIVRGLEVALTDQASGYGGTMDLVIEIDSQIWIVDFKTGSKARTEAVIQLAAYRALWQLYHPKSLPVVGGVILHCPLGGQLGAYIIDNRQLAYGASIFASLLHVHSQLKKLDLGTPNAAQ